MFQKKTEKQRETKETARLHGEQPQACGECAMWLLFVCGFRVCSV